MRSRIENHLFTQTGDIALADSTGSQIFDMNRTDLTHLDVVTSALELLRSDNRAINIQPYTKPDGEKMLGAVSFPVYFPWMVISERSEADAYLAMSKMLKSLLVWIIIGMAVAIVAAIFFAQGISKPILEIRKVVA